MTRFAHNAQEPKNTMIPYHPEYHVNPVLQKSLGSLALSGCLNTLSVHVHFLCAWQLPGCPSTLSGCLGDLRVFRCALGAWVLSWCLGALWVPERSVGSWVLCGFLCYLCVHGRFLLVPGLCLDSWAISLCIGAPSGYFSTPSGCLRALWVPGHSFIAAMNNRCFLTH